MIVNLKIPIECGETVCNTSITTGCRFRAFMYGNVPVCMAFGANLTGEYNYEGTATYKQYLRCKECREAQNG